MVSLSKLSAPFLATAAALIFSSSALAASLPPQATRSGQTLNATSMRACQARENAIKQRSQNLIRMTTNMESTFDSIATRVENYYNDKVVSAGKIVENYGSLVSNIGDKKMAVNDSLASASADLAGFSCSSGDPKLLMTKFREDMQTVKMDLGKFRMSIKDLIVAVHSINSTDNLENESPRPLKSPRSASSSGVRGGNQ